MMRTYRAELTLLLRRRLLLATVAVCLLAAVGGAALLLSTAAPAAGLGGATARMPTVESLAAAGGGSQIFRTIASFAGTLVFVVVVGVVAADFARGTIRTMLVRQPNRLGLLTGKLAALFTFAGASLRWRPSRPAARRRSVRPVRCSP